MKALLKKLLFKPLPTRIGRSNLYRRELWIEATLKSLPAGTKLLDAGAGETPYKKWCTHLQYTAQDFNQYHGEASSDVGFQMPKWDHSRIDIVSDITAIPVPDGTFDAVLCTEVLEHVPDPVRAIQELARVVRPGGEIIITAPFNSLTHFAPYHFSTGFNRFFYEHHFGLLGFEITEMTANGHYVEYIAQELRRIPEVLERYYGSKATPEVEKTAEHLLRLLEQYHGKNQGSEEVLCYGFFVRARKKQ